MDFHDIPDIPADLSYGVPAPAAAAPAPMSGGAGIFESLAARTGLSVPVVIGLSALLGLVVLSLLARFIAGRFSSAKRTSTLAKEVTKEAARAAVSSRQDTNPMISLMHASQAVGMLKSARHLIGDDKLTASTRFNVPELAESLQKTQDEVAARLVQSAPSLGPEGAYAIASGWGSAATPHRASNAGYQDTVYTRGALGQGNTVGRSPAPNQAIPTGREPLPTRPSMGPGHGPGAALPAGPLFGGAAGGNPLRGHL